ncbi:peroxiredoxin-like family protein [Roseimaritima sediminicola]|uniref:peroxiredoxin-like family protein n=1 Tax=Roseimaritima sediminicola TaxID=2662066 RepID=UPI0012984162|nr:peroxiredoxin-like family protein [Roseimaritima sediminicola]
MSRTFSLAPPFTFESAVAKVRAAVMRAQTQRLQESRIVATAPKTGDNLADFELPNHLGEKRSLATLRERGPVVVTFYRGGWCPYCNLELRAYQAVFPEIKAAGATLVAITPELPDASLSTAEKNGLEFEVLTDADAVYARQVGLVFTLPEPLRPIYQGLGINIEEHNGDGQFDLPLAATFVVDIDGSIASAFVNADYTARAEPSDVVKVLQCVCHGGPSGTVG